jgi:hypothetical protein
MGEPVTQEVLMASLVSFGRVGRGLLPLILAGVVAGCGSGEEVSAPPSSAPPTTTIPATVEPASLDLDNLTSIDTSAIIAGFLPEVTEDDIEVVEGDSGTSYRYVFPTRELTDGVTVDLTAHWNPVEGGRQPSLEWALTGDASSPTDFAFVASIPKLFGDTVDDMVFDPQPTEIIDADVVSRWDVDATTKRIVSAVSSRLIHEGDPSAVIMIILDHLNTQRAHAELTACNGPFRSAEAITQCYLAVVAQNTQTFGPQSCDVLQRMANATTADNEFQDPVGFSAACRAVIQLSTTGTSGGCMKADNESGEMARCLLLVGRLLLGQCPVDNSLERQICVYESAVALNMETGCNWLDQIGNAEMADDCRATITKDPSYCARTDDAALRASCCETFRGTDSYGTCIGEAQNSTTTVATEADTTTTSHAATTTVTDDTTTTEAGDEDGPPAIPPGVYTGSFDARIMADVISQDSGVPEINTMTIGIDAEGLVSGHLHVHQEGLFMGCPGAMSDWVGTVDPGQIIGPRLPLTVIATTKTMETVPFHATWADAQCLTSPEIEYNQGPLSLVFDTIQGGSLRGVAEDYVPFELQLVP